jgi:hypothetical protein
MDLPHGKEQVGCQPNQMRDAVKLSKQGSYRKVCLEQRHGRNKAHEITCTFVINAVLQNF